MPAKKTTLAAAEKRVIKNEMKTLARAHQKILADALKAENAAHKEFAQAQRKYKAALARIDKSVPRATATCERRMGILEGRLNS